MQNGDCKSHQGLYKDVTMHGKRAQETRYERHTEQEDNQ